jgi:hypothetical protein
MKAIRKRLYDCFTALLGAILFSACATTPQRPDHVTVRRRHDLENRSLATVTERLVSHTISDHTSRASELRGEFYTPINARFPLRDPASRSVFIREVRWQHGNRNTAVFSTRQRNAWIVFDAVEWRKDSVF